MNGVSNAANSVNGTFSAAPKQIGGWLRKTYLIFLITLLTGAVQRPFGGGDLEGSMTGVVIQSGNPVFKMLMIAVFGLTTMVLLIGLRRLRLPKGAGFALGFNALALLSILWSPLPQATLQGAVGLAFSALVAIYAVSFHSWAEFIRALVQVMAGLVVATGLLALLVPGYAFHSTSEFFMKHAGLLKGSYTHKNSLGAALTLALVVLTSLGREVLGRWLWWGIIAWASWLIMQTGSAKSLISVPAALLMGTLIARSGSRLTLGLIAGYAIAAITIFMIIGGGLDQLVGSTAESLGRDVTLSGRTLIWQTAIDYTVLSGQWLAGGSFQAAWPSGIGEYSQQIIGFNAGHPHNGFIAIFDDLGLLGLGLVFAAALSALKAGTDPDCGSRERRFMSSLLVMILVTNAGGTTLALPMSIAWFLFVLLPGISSWSRARD